MLLSSIVGEPPESSRPLTASRGQSIDEPADAASGILAAIVATAWLVSRRGMRVGRIPDTRFGLRLRFTRDEAADRELATQEIAIVQSTAQRTS